MKNKILAVILVLAILFTLCGCSDGTEPENRVIITALGLDEKNGKLILSCENADVVSNTNEDIYNSHFAAVSADNLSSALDGLENRSYGKIMFSQCPIILIGDSLKTKNFKDFTDFCLNEHEISFSVRLVSCKNAQEILNSDNGKDTLVGYELLKLIEYGNVSEKSESLPIIIEKFGNKKPFYLPRAELTDGQPKILRSEVKKIYE